MSATSYVVELYQDDREIVSSCPSATVILRHIELAAADGWIMRCIRRNYVEISEPELLRDAQAESTARLGCGGSSLSRLKATARPA